MQLCRSGENGDNTTECLLLVLLSVYELGNQDDACMQEDTQSYQCHHGAIASHTHLFRTFFPTLNWSKNPRFKANEQGLYYKKLITIEKSAVSNTTLVHVKKM